jgi:hypothetical protein
MAEPCHLLEIQEIDEDELCMVHRPLPGRKRRLAMAAQSTGSYLLWRVALGNIEELAPRCSTKPPHSRTSGNEKVARRSKVMLLPV